MDFEHGLHAIASHGGVASATGSEAIQAAVAGWTKQALSDALEAQGVPAGPINNVAEVFADPQVLARGMAIVRDGLPGVASPIVIDGARMVSDRPSPARPRD